MDTAFEEMLLNNMLTDDDNSSLTSNSSNSHFEILNSTIPHNLVFHDDSDLAMNASFLISPLNSDNYGFLWSIEELPQSSAMDNSTFNLGITEEIPETQEAFVSGLQVDDCVLTGENSVSDDSVDTSCQSTIYFQDVDEVIESTGLMPFDGKRRPVPKANAQNQIFERNFNFIEPLLDEAKFEEMEKQMKAEYWKSFKTEKNKKRVFWNSRVAPVLEELPTSFQRFALAGSTSGLTGKVVTKFCTLLKYIAESGDEEAFELIRACSLAAAICESDPNLKVFPNH
jgi:hypothetical protein